MAACDIFDIRYHFLKSPPLRGNITSFFPAPVKPKIWQNDLKLDTYDLKFWGHCGCARYFRYQIPFSQIAAAARQYHILLSCTSKYSLTQYQGSTFSDLSLISDFLPNFQDHSLDQSKSDEKTFWGGGVGVFEYNDLKGTRMHKCNSWSQKFSGGEPPHPPVRGCIA